MTEKQRQKMRKYMLRAEQWDKQLAEHVRQMSAGRPTSGYFPDRGPTNGVPGAVRQMRAGQLDFNVGETVQPNELKEYAERLGGNPYRKKYEAIAAKVKSAPKYRSEARMSNIMRDKLTVLTPAEKLAQELTKKQRQAFAANERRNQEIRANMDATQARVMAGLGGLGGAAEDQYRRDSEADLARIQAYLNSHGLTHSSILPAYMNKTSETLNRRIDEGRESRLQDMVSADMQLSAERNRFIEDQTDVAPPTSDYLDLMRQYAASGQGQGYGGALTQAVGNANRQAARRSNGPVRGVSAAGAQRIAAQLQGSFNPVGMAQGMYGDWGGGSAPPQRQDRGAQTPEEAEMAAERQQKKIEAYKAKKFRLIGEKFNRRVTRGMHYQGPAGNGGLTDDEVARIRAGGRGYAKPLAPPITPLGIDPMISNLVGNRKSATNPFGW